MKTRSRMRTIFKYSSLDAIPFAITVAQLGASVWCAATWGTRTALEITLMFPVVVFLAWYNPIISTHNFLHTPFFRSEWLNRTYAAFNSINLGLPQILYRFHHLNHHAHNNDRQAPDGTTRDHSSTYAYGRNGAHENVWSYCALGLFRPGTTEAWKRVVAKGQSRQLGFELAVCTLGIVLLLLLSWKFLLFFWLPAFYLGWFLAHAENYYEHFGANPARHHANSVSYYGKLYNRLMCNEGYHQEHHLRPQTHWTARPSIRVRFADKLADPTRTVARVPPLFGFLEHRRAPAFFSSTEVAVPSDTYRL